MTIQPDAKTDTWIVTFRLADRVQYTRVSIIEGYTTLADIPKIIAVARDCKPEDMELLRLVKEEDDAR